MILSALIKYYEDMSAKGDIVPYGWAPAKVSYALDIDENGELLQVISVKEISKNGKNQKALPRIMNLPISTFRSGGKVASNFMWDNSSYILGADVKKSAEQSKARFDACRKLHINLLKGLDIPEAKALVNFFKKWNPDSAKEHPALKEYYDDVTSSSNLVFQFHGKYIHDNEALKTVWQNYYQATEGEPNGICLVTGNVASVATLHPQIKGIPGAQSSGASLVSFNAPSFCSYGKEQGMNAPISGFAAFAYSTAINHLISDKRHNYRIGDTTVLCWSDGGESAYQELLGTFIFGSDSYYTENELLDVVDNILEGNKVEFDACLLDPQKPFYILGISPNAARLSVRFFMKNSFGNVIKNVNEHYERLKIKKGTSYIGAMPLWRLLNETVNENSQDKTPLPELSGEVLRAILTGERYPTTLLSGVTLRIRADHKMNAERAAIIKAYYLKNLNPYVPKEVLTVELNKTNTNIPYQLGRMFSVLEAIQDAANPGINTTIKDKYFNSASATPAHVFPVLINLAQKHLNKLNEGQKIYYNKQLTEIHKNLGEEYPSRLNLPQQGAFQLGYYHQTVARYEKKNREAE